MSSTERQPHRWAEVIKAWADGKAIQGRRIGSVEWHDFCAPGWLPAFNGPDWEWRVKPQAVRYRLALFREHNGAFVTTASTPETAAKLEEHLAFIRWLTDWQEVEV